MGWFILHPEEKGLILFRIRTNVARFTTVVQVEKSVHVRVTDGAGDQFLCPIDALKEVREATGEEYENCVDNAVAERYAGKIKVADKQVAGKSAITQTQNTYNAGGPWNFILPEPTGRSMI